MAAVTIQTNLPQLTADLVEGLDLLTNKDYIPRALAFDLLDSITQRVHIDGVASDGGQIGTYSRDYLSLRQRKYNRSSDPKKIVSLTRQLENDWSVIATDNGYGLGFKNPFNLQKAEWVEEQSEREIWDLTVSEQQLVDEIVQKLVDDALK